MITLGFVMSLLATVPASATPARTATACVGETEANIEGDDALPAPVSALPVYLLEDYATPAVIDCRVPRVSPALWALVGECAGVTVTDASYRTSRWPESEAPVGTFAPVRPDASAKLRLHVMAGVPAQPTTTLAPPSVQPLALFALPDFPRPAVTTVFSSEETAPQSALGRRLERPPRA